MAPNGVEWGARVGEGESGGGRSVRGRGGGERR